MVASVGGGGGGFAEYVLDGTLKKPRDKDLIEIIDGDLDLTKAIYESDTVKQTYTRLVLSFKGEEDKDIMKKAYEDFKNNFLVGFEKDEINIVAVIHYDTHNYHIHICIPKKNLLNGKHNNYYYDKIDRNRINLIRDYINEKYKLPQEEKKEKSLIKKDKKINRLDKNDYLSRLSNNNLINNIKDIEETLQSLDLKVVNRGYDKPTDTHYLTIMDPEGNKLKLKGELYNEQYYRTKNQRTTGTINKNISTSKPRNARDFQEIKSELEKANAARYKRVKARTRTKENQPYMGVIQGCNMDDGRSKHNNTINENNNNDRATTTTLDKQNNKSNSRISTTTIDEKFKKLDDITRKIKQRVNQTIEPETTKEQKKETTRKRKRTRGPSR